MFHAQVPYKEKNEALMVILMPVYWLIVLVNNGISTPSEIESNSLVLILFLLQFLAVPIAVDEVIR